jgi:hypothetical protein
VKLINSPARVLFSTRMTANKTVKEKKKSKAQSAAAAAAMN